MIESGFGGVKMGYLYSLTSLSMVYTVCVVYHALNTGANNLVPRMVLDKIFSL